MAVTQTQYTGNGNTVLYSFTFPYLATTDVKVKINGVTQPTTAYSLANATTVQMNSAPANGATVLIFRDTDNDNKKATFYPGSAIKAEDLNDNIDQILYVAQEVDNNAMSTLGDDAMQGDLSLGNNKITNLGNPVNGTDAVNKTTLDSTIDTAIESDVLVGTDLSKSASGGQVTISHNVSGANTTINNSAGNVVQDITISAQGHVTSAGSVNLDNRYYTETELDAGQLDNRYFTETELSGGQLNNLYYTETELDGGQLDNRYFTETELNNGALDTRYFTEAELNNGQLDTRYFRQDSSETITSGATWSGSDNFIATTAAIDARIVDLVDDVGGFVPIANETSFPATNPDVNNGTGTLVSIKSITSARTPSGGSVVITDGAGSGNDVTITGLGTTVLPAGYGVIVETTGTTHTYTFHRLSPDATSVTAVSAIPNEIATVAGISSHVQTVSGINNDVQVVSANNSNVTSVAGSITSVNTAASNLDQIQNFANVYRIVSSDPTTSLNAGDLIFNTSTNKFRVYTGSSWVDAVARQFSDNTKMQFGNGNDLEIFHDGTNSKLVNNTGHLKVNAGSFHINNVADNESLGIFVGNGGVALFYDNSKKIETRSDGIEIFGDLIVDKSAYARTMYQEDGTSVWSTGLRLANDPDYHIFRESGGGDVVIDNGNLELGDSQKVRLGNSNDLEIYHDGSDSYVQDIGTGKLVLTTNGESINLYDSANSNILSKFITGGAAELYYDGSKKFETKSWGVQFNGDLENNSDSSRIKLGVDDDLQLFHDGSNSLIYEGGTGNLAIQSTAGEIQLSKGGTFAHMVRAIVDGSVKLYHAGNEVLTTTADGIQASTDSGEGSIYIKGAEGGSSALYLHADQADDNNDQYRIIATDNDAIFLQNYASGGWETNLKAIGNGTTELYYDNSKKFETTSGGIDVDGSITCDDIITAGALLHEGDTNTLVHFSAADTIELKTGGFSRLSVTNTGLALTGGYLNSNGNRIILGDSSGANDDRLVLGDNNDLQLYHDGTQSVIKNATGNLDIITGSTSIHLQSNDGSETLAEFTPNGSVDLYYDNTLKFQTTSSGATVTNGHLVLNRQDTSNEGGELVFNRASDNAGHWTNDVYGGDDSARLRWHRAGTEHLSLDHNELVAKAGTDIKIASDTGKFLAGTDADLAISHDGSNSYIDNNTGVLNIRSLGSGANVQIIADSDYMARFVNDGAVELYYDNNKKLETTSSGVALTGITECSNQSDISSQTNSALILKSSTNAAMRANFLLEDDYVSGRGALAINVTEAGVTNDRDLLLNRSGGRVGIQCDPSTLFEVGGASQFNSTVKVKNTFYVESSQPKIELVDTDNNSDFIIQNDHGVFTVRDTTNSANRLRIEADGDVLFPNNGGNNRIEKFSTSGGPYLLFHNRGANTSHSDIYDIGGISWAGYRDVANPAVIASVLCERRDHANGASSRGHIVFRTGANGSSYGYTTPSEVCRVTADGIAFNGDTVEANSLDDYEEGTWTPAFNSFTNVSSSNVRQALYTKIGNTVHVWLEVFGENNMSWTNSAYISGFPFTGSGGFATSLYIPVNLAVMYGPSDYSMDQTTAGRAYFYGWGDKAYFQTGTISNVRHIWMQITYRTSLS